jgi:hypothetical protein
VDTAHASSGQIDLIEALGCEELAHRPLIREIKLRVRSYDKLTGLSGAPALERADNGRTHHATVAGDKDASRSER